MKTKYFINSDGDYIGGFLGAIPQNGAIEVDSPPTHGWQKYDLGNNVWFPLTDDQLKVLSDDNK